MTSVAYVVDEWIALSQTFIRNEIAELRRQGVRIEVVALGRGDVEAGADEPAIFLPDLVPVSAAGRVRTLLAHPRDAARIARAQAAIRPERVRYRAALPAIAARLRSQHVTWVHAHFGWEAAASAEVLAAVLGTGWSFTAHANDIFVTNTFLAGRLARADRLVTVCHYNEREMRATYGTLPATEIIACGVELPADDGRERGQLDLDILAVGRLVPKKGFDLLLRAAAAERVRRPLLSIEIVGDGPERAALEALVVELGLSGTVRLLGARPHGWVLGRMQRTRVVCLPARIADDGDRDSMPVVLKEAMVRRVPVVSTSVAAIPELVDDTVGRLVEPDDVDALGAALDELLSDGVLARRLGDAARDRVIDQFTLSGEVGRLRSCFEQWSGC